MAHTLRPLSRLYTVKQVARACKVSERTVRRWTASGELPYHKLNRCVRVSHEDFRRFVGNKRYAEEIGSDVHKRRREAVP